MYEDRYVVYIGFCNTSYTGSAENTGATDIIVNARAGVGGENWGGDNIPLLNSADTMNRLDWPIDGFRAEPISREKPGLQHSSHSKCLSYRGDMLFLLVFPVYWLRGRHERDKTIAGVFASIFTAFIILGDTSFVLVFIIHPRLRTKTRENPDIPL